MSRNRVLVLLFVLLPAASAVAQSRFELTPFYGLRAGGSFRVTDLQLALDIQRSGGYGLTFGTALNENMQVEFLWSRQKSSLEPVPLVPTQPDEPAPDDELTPMFDIRVDYFHGAFVYGGGPRSFQPYIAVGAGMSVFDPDVAAASTLRRFSFSLGTGFKSFFNDTVGIRFDARAFGTRIGDKREDVTCDIYGCVTFESAATFWQGQVVGGVIFAF